MRLWKGMLLAIAVSTFCISAVAADPSKPAAKAASPSKPKPQPQPAFLTPAEAGPDFLIQGEYSGLVAEDGDSTKVGVQVIALGDGKFHAVGYMNGLPGDGWDKSPRIETDSQTKNGLPTFSSDDNGAVVGTIRNEVLVVENASGTVIAKMKKVQRQSPTLGAKPPAGAVVLFDGATADHFVGGRMTPDHLLMEGCTSKEKFQNFTLHVEFVLPFMPTARGQGRANSGVYCQGRYETQVLDSFGLAGEDNECGGIYKIAKPLVNMCYPPLAWQTYDIDFTAAVYRDGKKTQDAQITVRHNGVLIQDHVGLPHATTAAPVKEGPEPGPIYLQNHGNPVRFRNIWVLERK